MEIFLWVALLASLEDTCAASNPDHWRHWQISRLKTRHGNEKAACRTDAMHCGHSLPLHHGPSQPALKSLIFFTSIQRGRRIPPFPIYYSILGSVQLSLCGLGEICHSSSEYQLTFWVFHVSLIITREEKSTRSKVREILPSTASAAQNVSTVDITRDWEQRPQVRRGRRRQGTQYRSHLNLHHQRTAAVWSDSGKFLHFQG